MPESGTFPSTSPGSSSPAALVERLVTTESGPDGQTPIVIPSLQREFCWKRTQITSLFDSLLRGLPIGSLLLWNVSDDAVLSEEATYEFIRRYANSSEFPIDENGEEGKKYVRNTSAKLNGEIDSLPVEFALDGQQRLTSLLIGLEGRFYRHKKHYPRDRRTSYTSTRLCFDLFTDPEREDRESQGDKYQFTFRDEGWSKLTDSGENYWWPVEEYQSIIDGCEVDEEGIDEVLSVVKKDVDEATGSADFDAPTARKNLKRLAETLIDTDRIQFERVTDMSSETAVELFVRRNDGGEPLGNEDIAFSLMAVYWPEVDGLEIDSPKSEIEDFNSKLSRRFGSHGFGFGKSFTIRALLTLGKQDPSFRRENFTPETMKKTGRTWKGPKFEQAISDAFRVVTEDLRLSSKCLTSKTAILPLCYYFFYHHTEGSADEIDLDVISQMDLWLTSTALNNVLEQGPKQVLDPARELIEEYYPRFPAEDILNKIEREEDSFTLPSEDIDALVEETDYHSTSERKQLILSRLYTGRIGGVPLLRTLEDENSEVSPPVQIDHIYPRNQFDEGDSDTDPEDRFEDFEAAKEQKHSLANLQLLAGGQGGNSGKSDMDPIDWLEREETEEEGSEGDFEQKRRTHHLPFATPGEYTYGNFLEFCEKRERGLVELLQRESRLPLEVEESAVEYIG